MRKMLLKWLFLVSVFLFPVVAEAEDIDTSQYFYNQLTEDEKGLYQVLNDDGLNKNPNYSYTAKTSMTADEWAVCFTNAQVALQADNPMYAAKRTLWYHNFLDDTKPAQATRYGMMTPIWDEDSYWLQKAEAKKEQIIASVGDGDRYTKLRKLYDYMSKNMQFYCYEGELDSQTYVFVTTYLGCLTMDEGICSGFSSTFKYLCDAMEIPCIIVGNSMHAWNYVQMEDGKWYAVDISASVANSGNQDYSEGLLLGSNTDSYIRNSNYWASDLYLGTPDDFNFPTLSETQYVYQGENTDFSYTEAANTFVENNCEKSGHQWSYPEVRNNNCAVTGAFVYTCSVCQTQKVIENGWPILDQHDTETITVKEACCEGELIQEVCKICGKVISERSVANHTEKRVVTKEATCKEAGIVSIICENCGEMLGTEEIPKIEEHQYTQVNDGFYNMQMCSVCSEVQSKTKIKLSAVTIKKVKGAKKAFTVQWKKSKDKDIKYQIQCSTSKKFNKAKTINAKTALKYKVKKLKKNKTYYVRVRAYRKGVSCGKKVTLYSKWSKIKKVTTK